MPLDLNRELPEVRRLRRRPAFLPFNAFPEHDGRTLSMEPGTMVRRIGSGEKRGCRSCCQNAGTWTQMHAKAVNAGLMPQCEFDAYWLAQGVPRSASTYITTHERRAQSVLVGCAAQQNKMKKVAFVILNQFADWESAYLASALSMIGNGAYENAFVSVTTDPVLSIGGMSVTPAGDLTACSHADGLVLVGSTAWKTSESERAASTVAEFWKTGRPLGAIGDSVSLLATLGILNERRHTANSQAELASWAQDAYTGSTLFEKDQAVRDGNLVTANDTGTLQFAREMLVLLGIAPVDAKEWFVFHSQGISPSSRTNSN